MHKITFENRMDVLFKYDHMNLYLLYLSGFNQSIYDNKDFYDINIYIKQLDDDKYQIKTYSPLGENLLSDDNKFYCSWRTFELFKEHMQNKEVKKFTMFIHGDVKDNIKVLCSKDHPYFNREAEYLSLFPEPQRILKKPSLIKTILPLKSHDASFIIEKISEHYKNNAGNIEPIIVHYDSFELYKPRFIINNKTYKINGIKKSNIAKYRNYDFSSLDGFLTSICKQFPKIEIKALFVHSIYPINKQFLGIEHPQFNIVTNQTQKSLNLYSKSSIKNTL